MILEFGYRFPSDINTLFDEYRERFPEDQQIVDQAIEQARCGNEKPDLIPAPASNSKGGRKRVIKDTNLNSEQIQYVIDCVAKWMGVGDPKAFQSDSPWPEPEDANVSPLLKSLLLGEESIPVGEYGFFEIHQRQHLKLDADRLKFVLARISQWISLWITNR